ncbi:MAG: DUF2961 domain-containing protein, partial [bacterium]
MRNVLFVALIACMIVGCSTLPRMQEPSPLSLWGWAAPGHAARSSSWDRTGANNDSIQIRPGESPVLADIKGPGIIRHIWITTNVVGPNGRTLILRMYWDGSETPAVETPLGDFFCVAHGMQANVNSFPVTVVSAGRSRNSWWPMPFSKGAKITITNEGPVTHGAFYYHVDYLALDGPPPTTERFYAEYRQAYPAAAPGNYTILETQGSGRYMGCVMGVESTAANWWGEGDDLIEVDGYEPLRGTGTEEFFGDAWGQHADQTLWHGAPVVEGFDAPGLRSSMYRFHILDPIPFKKRIKVSIEHGAQNNRADNLSSVAFWYQTPPARPHPALPELVDRLVSDDRASYLRDEAWRLAAMAESDAEKKLDRLLSLANRKENVALIRGLQEYVRGKESPSDDALHNLDQRLAAIEILVELQPEAQRFRPAVVEQPTDDDNAQPSTVVQVYRVLERAKFDLARRVAAARGLGPGDEIIVESRNAAGDVTPSPAYEETPDFTNSYAKVDDTHLMGNGARFTYGKTENSWARFTPDFPKSGFYEVFVIFSYGSNAGDTRYVVKNADGEETVSLAQRGRPDTPERNNNKWHSLGTYR